MFFAMETRSEVIEEFPSANFGEVAQILGEWWQDCSPSEKRKYQRMHEKDKVRYARECGGTYVPKPIKKPAAATTTKRKKPTSRKPAETDEAEAEAESDKKVTSYFGEYLCQSADDVSSSLCRWDVVACLVLTVFSRRHGQSSDQGS